MQYREHGRTGKLVSILGFGTSRFLRQDYANEVGREKLISLLVRANKSGINFFDTGDAYGDGRCEELLGDAFRRMPGEFYVSTKSQSLIDGDALTLRKCLDSSLKKMRLDKINFYHFWRILNMDQFHAYTRPGGPYEGALQAQKEGLIDHICFSAHCGGEEIADISATGCFEGVIVSYNIINFKYREQGLNAAKQHGLGVAIMNPLGGGVMPRNPAAFSFATPNGENISEIAMKFCASEDAVALVLSGITNDGELTKNLKSIENFHAFSHDQKKNIKNKLLDQFNFLCNGCQYCKGCPQKIEPYKLMLAYNAYILRNRSPRAFFEEIVNWRSDFPRKPYPCKGCGICENKCSQHISIIKNIAEINELIINREKFLNEGLQRCFSGSKRIGIFGTGEYAREMLLQYCQTYGKIEQDLVFFDSNKDKIGQKFLPYTNKIYSPNDISSLKIQRLIIATEDYYDEIYNVVRNHEKAGVEIVGYSLGQQYKKLH